MLADGLDRFPSHNRAAGGSLRARTLPGAVLIPGVTLLAVRDLECAVLSLWLSGRSSLQNLPSLVDILTSKHSRAQSDLLRHRIPRENL
jgi:hypothetical protein